MKTIFFSLFFLAVSTFLVISQEYPITDHYRNYKSIISLIDEPDQYIGTVLEVRDSSILLANTYNYKLLTVDEFETYEFKIQGIEKITLKPKFGIGWASLTGLILGCYIGYFTTPKVTEHRYFFTLPYDYTYRRGGEL